MSQQPVTAEDLYLYAMQLLEPEEHARLEQFLTQSPEARAELAKVRGDLALLALAAEQQTPSPLTRQRLLKQVAREKKATHSVETRTAERTPERVQTRQHTIAESLADPRPGGLTPLQDIPADVARDTYTPSRPAVTFGGYNADQQEDDEEDLPRRGILGVLFPWVGWAVAAGLAVSTYDLYHRNQAVQDQLAFANAKAAQATASSAKAQQVLDVLRSGAAQRFTLTKQSSSPQPTGRVVYLADTGSLVFQANNMEQLPPYKTYELWLIPQGEGHQPIPAGTFKPDERGYATVILPDLPKGTLASTFGVTMEDDGGSQQPTLPILMIGS